MDLFSSFSDDQVALIGCAAALFCAGLLMTVSYYVGNRERKTVEVREQILATARRNADQLNKAA